MRTSVVPCASPEAPRPIRDARAVPVRAALAPVLALHSAVAVAVGGAALDHRLANGRGALVSRAVLGIAGPDRRAIGGLARPAVTAATGGDSVEGER